jgi:hypothetical protein
MPVYSGARGEKARYGTGKISAAGVLITTCIVQFGEIQLNGKYHSLLLVKKRPQDIEALPSLPLSQIRWFWIDPESQFLLTVNTLLV